MVRLSCGVQCTRTILFILNILFFIFGFTLLGFGIYVKVSKTLHIALSEHINTKIIGGSALEWIGVIMIIVAVFTILLSAFGCLGALFKNRVFLYLYAVILSLVIITELAALIITLTYRVRIRDSYYHGFQQLFIEIYSNNHTDLKYVIEDIEREFKCCGIDNVTDYYEHNYTVPVTCYQDEDFHKSIFDQGCANAIIQWLWHQFPIIGSVLGGILLIEIFGIISSIALGTAISHSSYSKIYE
ncbi:unnamed protein product [Rotaria sp. Silwood1]|nr:unnamed protein product [Rotaria sp. Silwood1]CAF1612054.1 unnamed protein product [Rotaria sp. Silwood1]CAF3755278.1 unnamed protein product [Rotaria sp. Silwood1]CAF4609857.1 unnamed protein product [Rotaria sp. Silwood1]